jgi:hypothetical protein
VSLFYILLGATADVLQISRYTQSLIMSASQLLFEHLNTSRQFITRVLGSLIGVWILRIHCLFVSHRFLLSISSASSTRASAQLYGAAKFSFKGRLFINPTKNSCIVIPWRTKDFVGSSKSS